MTLPPLPAHSIAGWWKRDGADRYRRGRQLLILADTGGSNSCRTGAWKTELQAQLCNSFGLTVTVAHYPTERLQMESQRAPPIFQKSPKTGPPRLLTSSYPKVLNFIRHTCTRTGLAVSALPRPKASIQPAPHPIQSTSAVFVSNDIRLYPPGTIRLLQCESIVASALS